MGIGADGAADVCRVAVVFGTRPEAIKMAPIVRALEERDGIEPVVIVTAQHREMLDQVLDLAGIVPDHDLQLQQPRQTLTMVTVGALQGLEHVYAQTRPDLVLVQGDTTTTMAAALAAFYAQIPVAHVEAGLRTHNRWSPYPEEVNRVLTTRLTSLHLAPTRRARENLVSEGVDPESIVVTGNTVIDALLWAVGQRPAYGDDELEQLEASGRRTILVTTHRRESWGEPMAGVADAIGRLARSYPDVTVVLPMHRNPVVRDVLVPRLGGVDNVLLTDPLPYGPFARLMAHSHLLLTDSGGVQEEGPSLSKPVLVMRDTTERPEAIEAGTAKLVGTDPDAVVAAVSELLDDARAYAEMANAVNPYGDGHAAERSAAAISRFMGLSDERVEEFAARPGA